MCFCTPCLWCAHVFSTNRATHAIRCSHYGDPSVVSLRETLCSAWATNHFWPPSLHLICVYIVIAFQFPVPPCSPWAYGSPKPKLDQPTRACSFSSPSSFSAVLRSYGQIKIARLPWDSSSHPTNVNKLAVLCPMHLGYKG